MSISSKSKIILIGGAEIAIENRPLGQLQFGSENPGTISLRCTGKMWDLSAELIKDGYSVEYISVAGNDFAGLSMKLQLEKIGVGVDCFHLIDGMDTAARNNILNLLDQPEMEFQNTDIFSSLTIDMIDQATESFATADCIVMETRFTEEVLTHITTSYPQIPILLLPDSEENAVNVVRILDRMDGILTGRRQAEVLSNLSILSEEELLAAADWFFNKGIPKVFIDLGFGGIYYQDEKGAGVERPGPIRIATIVEGFVNHQTAAKTASKSIQR